VDREANGMSDACRTCGNDTSKWSGQLDARFDMPSEHLSWNDGPLAGIVVCKECRQTYAFQCTHNIWNTLLHWALIKVAGPREGEPEEAYADDARAAIRWLSVTDDQRPGQSTCVAVWVQRPAAQLSWYIPGESAKLFRRWRGAAQQGDEADEA
jgi:hypothetical protein